MQVVYNSVQHIKKKSNKMTNNDSNVAVNFLFPVHVLKMRQRQPSFASIINSFIPLSGIVGLITLVEYTSMTCPVAHIRCTKETNNSRSRGKLFKENMLCVTETSNWRSNHQASRHVSLGCTCIHIRHLYIYTRTMHAIHDSQHTAHTAHSTEVHELSAAIGTFCPRLGLSCSRGEGGFP